MKKIFTLILTLIFTVIVVLLVAPFFYSIDELKPRIEQLANEKVRGEVKINSLSFALFPVVKLGADGVDLFVAKKSSQEPFAKIASVEVRMSLWSLLSSPVATLRVSDLKLLWEKDLKKGDNLEKFLLPKEEVEPSTLETASDAEEKNPLETLQTEVVDAIEVLPSWIRDRVGRAKFSFELLNADVRASFKSVEQNMEKRISNFDFKILEIGFNTPVSIKSSGELDFAIDGVTMKGPFAFSGETIFDTQKSGSSRLEFKLEQDWSKIEVLAFDLLKKTKGTPFGLNIGGELTLGAAPRVDFNEFTFSFGSVRTQGSVNIDLADMSQPKGEVLIESDTINLADLATLLPLVETYKLKGETAFKLRFFGNLLEPGLDISSSFKGVTGTTPGLAHPISNLKGALTVKGTSRSPVVEIKDTAMNIAQSDFSFSFKSQGLEKIRAQASLSAQLLNIDELMGTDITAVGSKKTGVSAPSSAGGAAPEVGESLDVALDEMAPMVEEALKNELLDIITLDADVKFKKIKILGAEYENAGIEARLANRKLNIKSAEMVAYGGRMTAALDMNLNPGLLEYDLSSQLNNIYVGRALAAHMPEWKDELSGQMRGQLSLSGKGLRKAQLAKNLKGSFDVSLKEGALNMPVLKPIAGVLNSLPDAAKSGVDSKLGDQEFAGEFRTMKLVGTVQGRKILLRDMDVVFDPAKAKIEEFRFKAKGEVTFDKDVDFEATAMLSPNLIRVKEWRGSSGLVEIPMKLSGTMDDPKPDVAYSVKVLTERLAKGAAKEQIKKIAPKIVDKIKEKAPAPVKKEVDKLKKRFGL